MKVSLLALKLIQDEYHAGATQEELAKKYHSTQAGIQRILSGKRKLSGIKLDTFEKMFPNATINLEGNVSVGAHSAANIASPAAVAINGSCGDHSEALRAKIILSVLDLELAPEVQAQVLKVIKNTKLETK